MNRKKKIASLFGLATIIGAGALAVGANAYRGDYSQKGPNFSEERHAQMEKIFENSDYTAWKEMMNGRGRVLEVINSEENFQKFVQARKLAMEGKHEEADAIRTELGLRTRNGEPKGTGYGKGQGRGHGQGLGRMAK